ncbi:hypothetical protein GQ53DRAFT_285422 [Thozetella sp. PMI_491]|nr:hypothetical protein GQ53DRAFT_285422 [Thozetella sp. PMI_491]
MIRWHLALLLRFRVGRTKAPSEFCALAWRTPRGEGALGAGSVEVNNLLRARRSTNEISPAGACLAVLGLGAVDGPGNLHSHHIIITRSGLYNNIECWFGMSGILHCDKKFHLIFPCQTIRFKVTTKHDI